MMEIETKTIENDLEFLRQISREVDFEKDNYKEVIEKLDYYCKNVGLVMAMAAVQIGIPLRILYLKKTDFSRLDEEYNEGRVLINPKILKQEGLTTYWEACASCLDNFGLVERPYKMEIEYYDENGKRHVETFEGTECTVICHELDHLDGVLHMDKAIKLMQMAAPERKTWRESHPYTIIRKDGPFISEKQKILTKGE